LTVADVRATNPKLWNSWKASLLDEFYEAVKRALRRGVENPIDKDQLISETQDTALRLLRARWIRRRRIRRAWANLTDEYFLRHSPEEIAWHTEMLVSHDDPDSPLVAVKQESAGGGTAILVYTEEKEQTFARVTAMLDELGLNIVDARITPTADGRRVDTYLVLEGDGTTIEDSDRLHQVEGALAKAVLAPDMQGLTVTRQAPRQVRMFSTPTRIEFTRDLRGRTLMELIAGDRPGLLSEVGRVLLNAHIAVHAAKIMTIGERAEDVFYLSDAGGAPLHDATCDKLRQQIVSTLDPAH